jgi:hypothetical protein
MGHGFASIKARERCIQNVFLSLSFIVQDFVTVTRFALVKKNKLFLVIRGYLSIADKRNSYRTLIIRETQDNYYFSSPLSFLVF